ncbi:MAG: SCO family protein [Gelidibacter sp.]
MSYKIDESGKKINYTITYENFTNQLSETFSTDAIKNKVCIANFFFTRCPSICPPMRTKLITIADTFNSNDDFLIISHTIDPENDSIEVLKNYSDATGIPPEKWQFVRSTLDNTRQQANLFMTNFKPNEEGTDFYHSSYVALVDKKQQIRGFYNLLVNEEVERLTYDIKFLLN